MNINRLNLNLLRVFAAIYENGTLTRAAQQLGLSQPAVSHALRQMRDTFEDELFVRVADGYRPTKKAKELAPTVLEALESLQGVFEDAHRFDPQTASKTFKLSVSDYSSHTILPRLARLIHEQAPGIRCAISQISYERVNEQLRQGEIDLAIVARQPAVLNDGEGLLLEESVVCVVRADHPRAHKRLDLATFTTAGHVIVNLYGQLHSWVDAKLAEMDKKRDVKLVVPYFNAVPEIVSTTDLIGSMPRRLAEQATRQYPLRLFPFPFEFPPVHFVMCWHPRRERDLELRWLRGALTEICRSL